MIARLAPGDDLAALVRTSDVDSLVIVVAPGRDALARATLLASLGPLAIEAAPARRINAVLPAIGADPEAIDAAVAFLERARSTTGQAIEISAT